MTIARWEKIEDRVRCGFKGPAAAEWLRSRSWAVPQRPNSWLPFEHEGVIARLGASEFFVESLPQTAAVLRAALASRPAGVYPVLREDSGFALDGDGAHDALAQVCNVDFAAMDVGASPIVMTLMIGVAVLVLPEGEIGRRRYRIWCDPSFGGYLDGELKMICEQQRGARA